MYRQGDVLIVSEETYVKLNPSEKVDLSEAKLVPSQGRVVLAEGEATGHAHAIYDDSAQLFEIGKGEGNRVLRLLKPVDLKHEEHAPVSLAAGLWRVLRQREYSPDEIRYVAD